MVASSINVTIITSGVPRGTRFVEDENNLVAKYTSMRVAHAITPTVWNCFRRIGDDREALA